MNKLFRCYGKFLVSGVVLLCLIGGAFVLRSYSIYPFSMQKTANQIRQPTVEEINFLKGLVRITQSHFDQFDRINDRDGDLILKYCFAKMLYQELADSNVEWIAKATDKKIRVHGEKISEHLYSIARSYDRMSKSIDTSSSQQHHSFYEAQSELFHNIRLLNTEISDIVLKNYTINQVLFTNEVKGQFDQLITQLPTAIGKKYFETENRDMDVVDMFIICLGSQELVDKYNGDRTSG